MPIAFVVFQVELRVAVIGDPNAAGGDTARSAQSDEDAGHFFAIPLFIFHRFAGVSDWTVAVFDIFADPIVEGFDMLPSRLRF